MSKPTLQLTPFDKDKGERLTRALQDQIHPLINSAGIVAAKVIFLYEGKDQMLGGGCDFNLHPAAGELLAELMRQRLSGALPLAHKEARVLPIHKKS